MTMCMQLCLVESESAKLLEVLYNESIASRGLGPMESGPQSDYSLGFLDVLQVAGCYNSHGWTCPMCMAHGHVVIPVTLLQILCFVFLTQKSVCGYGTGT